MRVVRESQLYSMFKVTQPRRNSRNLVSKIAREEETEPVRLE
jgi:hypothetical protein